MVNDPQLKQTLSAEALAVAYVFLNDFEKSGIHLPDEKRARFVELSDEILVLGRNFLQHSGDTESHETESLPLEWLRDTPSAVTQALKRSYPVRKGALQLPHNSWGLQVVSKYVGDERARQLAYRGLNAGSVEQVHVLEQLLGRRAELAQLTGNNSFASMTLADKMARKPENVDGFLSALAKHHHPLAEKNLSELRAIKEAQQGTQEFFVWDRDYYAEKYLRALSLKTTAPPIGSFFSVGTVFAGLSRMFERLYGINLRASPVAHGEVWADDVCKMDVVEDGDVIGTIYADLYSRPGKPPSAAHYTVRCSRRTDQDDNDGDFEYGQLTSGEKLSAQQGSDIARPLEVETVSVKQRPGQYQLPIVVLLCDFVRPTVKDGPSLLSWHEVETLFHEMGHAIHCELCFYTVYMELIGGSPAMIGRTEYHNVSGTRCATDFVELPSILMEHFVSSPDVVELVARHHATDAPLPYQHLRAHLSMTRSLDSLDTHNQILLATLDQEYHSQAANGSEHTPFDSTATLRRLQSQLGLIKGADDVHWQVNFSHLFGYGATYYSYLFDRVIASRLWSHLFKRAPLDRQAGETFKTGVLAHGGGRDPWSMLADVLQDEDLIEGGGSSRAMEVVG